MVMLMVNRDNVAVVTMTMAKDPKLAETILTTFKNLKKQGYNNIIAVDGGSIPALIIEAEKLGVKFVKETGKGIASAQNQAYQEGYKTGKPIVAYTEPDKTLFPENMDALVDAVEKNKLDIAVAKRTKAEFKRLTLSQRAGETFGNVMTAIVAGRWTDALSGPRVVRREVIPEFGHYVEKIGEKRKGLPKLFVGKNPEKAEKRKRMWGYPGYNIAKAAGKGWRIGDVPVKALYEPGLQEGEKLKRGKGLGWNKELKVHRYRVEQERQFGDGLYTARQNLRAEKKAKRFSSRR
jgi:glycosyltransferase involved in cell wall biosynthesis